MVRITCQITDYSEPAKTEIKVHNHWSISGLVEIEVDGERHTVLGTDMIEAVRNAMNTNDIGV